MVLSSTSDGFFQEVMVFSNKWWCSPTSDGFLQQVMVLAVVTLSAVVTREAAAAVVPGAALVTET